MCAHDSIRRRKRSAMGGDSDARARFADRFGLDTTNLQQFDIYAALLRKWQRTINLVSPKTIDSLWLRHFWDSAQILDMAEGRRHWLDLGSGAGFPGLVIGLLLARAGEGSVQLVESDQRKCAFLREVSRETGVRVIVHNCRIEQSAERVQGPIDVVSARALTNLPGLIRYAQDYLTQGAIALFPKGQDIASELTVCAMDSSLQFETRMSETDASARIVIVRAKPIAKSSAG